VNGESKTCIDQQRWIATFNFNHQLPYRWGYGQSPQNRNDTKLNASMEKQVAETKAIPPGTNSMERETEAPSESFQSPPSTAENDKKTEEDDPYMCLWICIDCLACCDNVGGCDSWCCC
jgi:hypothetical protein